MVYVIHKKPLRHPGTSIHYVVIMYSHTIRLKQINMITYFNCASMPVSVGKRADNVHMIIIKSRIRVRAVFCI